MRLLVSVRDVDEAESALAGGADVIDVKDPSRGTLGVVAPSQAEGIRRLVADHRRISIVIGDVARAASARRAARWAARLAPDVIKVGLDRIATPSAARSVLLATCEPGIPVVAVVYADGAMSPRLEELLEEAVSAGAAGFLIDTRAKGRGTLFDHLALARLQSLVRQAHARGLFVAVAGGLSLNDVDTAFVAGADLIGVRGAACDGGRTGRVSASRVGQLAHAVRVRSSRELIQPA